MYYESICSWYSHSGAAQPVVKKLVRFVKVISVRIRPSAVKTASTCVRREVVAVSVTKRFLAQMRPLA